MIASALVNFASIQVSQYAMLLGTIGVICGSIGIATIILQWSELFGCLNPTKVLLYFSGGIVIGGLILWLFKGLDIRWLVVCVCLIPLLSLDCLRHAYRLISKDDLPTKQWGTFSLPWKPIVIVALYSFTYGLCTYVFKGPLGIHSGFGALFAGILIYALVCIQRSTFRFAPLYVLACVCMIVSILPFIDAFPGGIAISRFCALLSYTLCLISIMTILSHITYHYGVNAIWLFGIERAIRLISVQLGIFSSSMITSGSLSIERNITAIIVAAIVVWATHLFLSEPSSSPWGAILKGVVGKDTQGAASKHRLAIRCHEISVEYNLTSRENEVLMLLCERKTPKEIENELFIANSTVKTHTKHIYHKLGIHSKTELFEMLGVKGD